MPDNIVRIIDVETGQEQRSLTHPKRVSEVTWHPDGRHLAASGTDDRIYVWDLATGAQTILEGPIQHPTSLRFSPDGRLLASNGWDGQIRLWDPVTGRLLLSVPGIVSHVQVSRDRLGLTQSGQDLELWSYERRPSIASFLAVLPAGAWRSTGTGASWRRPRTMGSTCTTWGPSAL